MEHHYQHSVDLVANYFLVVLVLHNHFYHLYDYHLCDYHLYRLCLYSLGVFELVNVYEHVCVYAMVFLYYLLSLSSFWSLTFGSFASSFFDFTKLVKFLSYHRGRGRFYSRLHSFLIPHQLNFQLVNT
jgi:hypothetical protein